MRPRKTENRDLPPRMLRRSRKRKSGKTWVSYYYCGRNADGTRVEIPLGNDLDEAKLEWARLERKAAPKPVHLMGALFDKYEDKIIPGKKPRTQSDNRKELKQLRKAFETAPIEAITPRSWPSTEMPEPQRSEPTARSPCSLTCSPSPANGE